MNMLPTISLAQLPRTYEVARAALAECQNIDECKDWADKAAALASYAKQSQDETLMKMATRIRARAARRAGELLHQIETPEFRGNQHVAGAVVHTDQTRQSAARDAGMSKHQQVQATRIAAIPEQDFEAQVESPKPPTLTQLAQQGITPKPKPVLDLKGRDPREFNRALHFIALFQDYARDLGRADLDAALSALIDSERQTLRITINAVDTIHDRIMTRI